MTVSAADAARLYTGARPLTRAEPSADAGAALGRVAGDFARTLAQGEETAKAAMAGRADAHALVHALAEAELAVETAVTLRDRVVEAYQEILRMPV